MMLKGLAIFAALLAISYAPQAAAANPGDRPAAMQQSSASSAAPQSAASAPAVENEAAAAHDYQPPHITVANPAPVVAPWSFHEKITWAANLVLAFLGYAGILLAVSTLKKIEHKVDYAEAAAETVAACAKAALLNAQAVIDAERPWILITVEPSRSVENSFTVMASNRGRTPARIIATEERTKIAIDDSRLPKAPEYKNEDPGAPVTPIILLPGEATAIESFCREDVRGLCDSEERFKRIETWEEKVFLYGRVVYRDLISPPEKQSHETNWCCWYIHGRQNSGLVIAGPPLYNSHT